MAQAGGALGRRRGSGWLGARVTSMFGGLISWTGARAWRRALVLTLICTALFLPGLASNPPTDRDEARFAQASKQMLETGDYVDIRFQDDARHQKPVGVYWAQTASASLFGGADAPIWAYRIPSFLAAILAVLLTSWAARPLVGSRAAFVAAAMTAGVIVLSFEARTGKSDALLLAAVVAAQGALARLWFGENDDAREHGRNVFYFWTALAAGVLIKGPVIFLPVGGTLLWMCFYDRSLRGLGRLGASWGLIWFALLAVPWFVAIGVRTEGAFFAASLGEDLFGKVTESRERPGAPPGVFLGAFFGTFWPFTALAVLAIPYVWRWRRAPDTAFLLGWIVPTWIVFELVATKLPHYTLPTYPAIAALAAVAVLDGSARPQGPVFWVAAVLWALPAIALPLAFAFGPSVLAEAPVWPPMILGLLALAPLLLAWRWLRAGLWLAHVRSCLMGAALLYAAAYFAAFPSLSQIWISERITRLAEPWRACVAAAQGVAPADVPLGAVRYHEPSFVFLAGTDTQLLQPEEAGLMLTEKDGGLVWVARRADERRSRPDEVERFETALATRGLTAQALASTDGFQYNGGRPLVLTLYAREGDPTLDGCRGPAR